MPLVADLVTGVYLRPEGDGYIVGYDGNGEWNSDNLDPNYNSWDEVWEHLYFRFPTVFDAAKMDGAWAGYYDTSTIDNNAIIDYVDNIYFATGFTGRGLMQAPGVGRALTELITTGSYKSIDLSGLAVERVLENKKAPEPYVL